MHDRGGKGGEAMLGGFIMNIMLRGVGFVARLFIILLGVITLFFFTVFFVLFLLLWPTLPFVIGVLLVRGVMGLLKF